MTPHNPQLYPIYSKPFQEIIEEGYLYIDKTDLIYKMTHPLKSYVFLSRPRRFGKSLLVSTLKAYFEGKKDLFKGLKIEKLEKEWQEYPVLLFDMSGIKDLNKTNLEKYLMDLIDDLEEEHGVKAKGDLTNIRLKNLIKNVYKKHGKGVVLLIDEYDAPLLNVMHKENLEEVRDVMCNFFSPLKGSASYLKFVFLTGITKFSQLNFFSALNSIENISMDEDYASICGITEDEMQSFLKSGIESLAQKQGYSYDEAVEKLKSQYDGYHFTWPSPDIYNPYSLLCALNKKGIDNYWFETATPTFLIEALRTFNTKLEKIGNLHVGKSAFNVPLEVATSAIPILYQTGYLTIKDYNSDDKEFLIDIPNHEVEVGLMSSLLIEYVKPYNLIEPDAIARKLQKSFNSGNIEEALEVLQSFLSEIPYTNNEYNEGNFREFLYVIFRLLTQFDIRTEVRNAIGRMDMVVMTLDTVYIFELKFDGSAQDALRQIDIKNYATSFKLSGSKIVKIGVNFSSKTRTISDWEIG